MKWSYIINNETINHSILLGIIVAIDNKMENGYGYKEYNRNMILMIITNSCIISNNNINLIFVKE